MLEFHFFDVEAFGAFGVDLILHVDALEGEVPEKHAKHQNPYRPHIHLIVVDFFLEDLRSHVGSSAAKGIDILIVFSAKAQIANFDAISKRRGF
jgi:hypothetical protein